MPCCALPTSLCRCYNVNGYNIMTYHDSGWCTCWASCNYEKTPDMYIEKLRKFVVYQFGPSIDLQSGPCASCGDGAANGDETDVDCGGSCPACPSGNLTIASVASGRAYELSHDLRAGDPAYTDRNYSFGALGGYTPANGYVFLRTPNDDRLTPEDAPQFALATSQAWVVTLVYWLAGQRRPAWLASEGWRTDCAGAPLAVMRNGQPQTTVEAWCRLVPPPAIVMMGSLDAIALPLVFLRRVDVAGAPCAADHRVSLHACVACPAGTSNAAGDHPAGADTACDEHACALPYGYASDVAACAAPGGCTAAALRAGNVTCAYDVEYARAPPAADAAVCETDGGVFAGLRGCLWLAYAGSCTSAGASECRALDRYSRSQSNPLYPRGCYYHVALGKYYYNYDATADCTEERHCVCTGAMPVRGYQEQRKAVYGCPDQSPPGEAAEVWVEASAALGVRCCLDWGSFAGAVCASRLGGDCLAPGGASHAGAVDACAARGMRLCTAAELGSGVCCETGCGLDAERVWAGDPGPPRPACGTALSPAVGAVAEGGGIYFEVCGLPTDDVACAHRPCSEAPWRGGGAAEFDAGRSAWRCGAGANRTDGMHRLTVNGAAHLTEAATALFHGPRRCAAAGRQRYSPYWFVADGCPGDWAVHNTRLRERRQPAAVRCCPASGTACVARDDDRACLPSAVGHAEARAACAGLGLRLCSRAELGAGRCCGLGCAGDTEAVWTSDTDLGGYAIRAVTAEGEAGCSGAPDLARPDANLLLEQCIQLCAGYRFLEHSQAGACACFAACNFTRGARDYPSPVAVLEQTANATCHDGLRNGDEARADCGGSCAPCAHAGWVLRADSGRGESGCLAGADIVAGPAAAGALADCQAFCGDYPFLQFEAPLCGPSSCGTGLCACFPTCDYARPADTFAAVAEVWQKETLCEDIPDWADSDGDTCDTYARRGWCASPWIPRYAPASGISAAVACCACAGGAAATDPSAGWAQGPSGALVGCRHLGGACPFAPSLAACKEQCLTALGRCNAVNYHAASENCCPQECADPNTPAFVPERSPGWAAWAHAGGGWTTAVQLSHDAAAVWVDVAAAAFDAAFQRCPVVRYLRNGAVHALYKRTSPVPEGFEAYRVFTDSWRVTDDNLLHTDFELFSSDDDMWANAAPWQCCVDSVSGVGFPGSCGPELCIIGDWFVMPGGGGRGPFPMQGITGGAALQYYSGSPCPSQFSSGWITVPDVAPGLVCLAGIEAASLAAAKTACANDPHCFAVMQPGNSVAVPLTGDVLRFGTFYGVSSSTAPARCPVPSGCPVPTPNPGWKWHFKHRRHLGPTPDSLHGYTVVELGDGGHCRTYRQGWAEVQGVAPKASACRLPEVEGATLAACRALCERHPHCYAVAHATRDAALGSGAYRAGRCYGLSSAVGCGLCGVGRPGAGLAVHYRAPRHVDPLPDADGRHNVVEVAFDGTCSAAARGMFPATAAVTTGTCASNGYASVTTPMQCLQQALAVGLVGLFTLYPNPVQHPELEECTVLTPPGSVDVLFGLPGECGLSRPCVCVGVYGIELQWRVAVGAAPGGPHRAAVEVYSDAGVRRPLAPPVLTAKTPSQVTLAWALADGGPVPATVRVWNLTAAGPGCELVVVAMHQGQRRLVRRHALRGDRDEHVLLVASGVRAVPGPAALRPPRVHTTFTAELAYTDHAGRFADLGDFVADAGFAYVAPSDAAEAQPAHAVQLELTSPGACAVYLVYPSAGEEPAHARHRPWIASEGWAVDRGLAGPTPKVSGDVFQSSEVRVRRYPPGRIQIRGHNSSAAPPLVFVRPRTVPLHRTHNVAAQAAGGIPFASGSANTSCAEPRPRSGLGAVGPGCWTGVNDGLRGDAAGWRPGAAPHDGLRFVGVKLADAVRVRYVAFGRDDTGRFPKGRWEGVQYTLQYTADVIAPTLVSAEPADLAWLDGVRWTTHPETFTLASARTHVYELEPAVPMTAMRLLVSSAAAAIDELEVSLDSSLPPSPSVLFCECYSALSCLCLPLFPCPYCRLSVTSAASSSSHSAVPPTSLSLSRFVHSSCQTPTRAPTRHHQLGRPHQGASPQRASELCTIGSCDDGARPKGGTRAVTSPPHVGEAPCRGNAEPLLGGAGGYGTGAGARGRKHGAPTHKGRGSTARQDTGATPGGTGGTATDREGAREAATTQGTLPGARATPDHAASGGGCLLQPRWAVCTTRDGTHQGQTSREP